MPQPAPSAASTRSPEASRTRPSPIAASATCESGARSPEHPSEPYSRTIGVMPALSIAGVRLDDDRAHAGVGGRERLQAQQLQRAHDLALDLGAGAGRVRADEARLQLQPALGSDERGRERAEARSRCRSAVRGRRRGLRRGRGMPRPAPSRRHRARRAHRGARRRRRPRGAAAMRRRRSWRAGVSVTVVMVRFHTVPLARDRAAWHPVSVMPDTDSQLPLSSPAGSRRRSDAADPRLPRAAARSGRGIHPRRAARHPAIERLPPARDARRARVRRARRRRAPLGPRHRRVRARRRLRPPAAARPPRPTAASRPSPTAPARARTSR